MEPLSVAASVIGLITAAGQMTTLLYRLGSEIKDAPNMAKSVVSELNDITVALTQLKRYLDGQARASAQRRSLITVEHITASITSCVMTYSELDTLLKSLHLNTGMGPVDRAAWVLKKEKVKELLIRLQNHKATLSLMLNIMQCASQMEAEGSMHTLCIKVDQILSSNEQISIRLRNIEDVYTRQRPISVHAGAQDSDDSRSNGADSPVNNSLYDVSDDEVPQPAQDSQREPQVLVHDQPRVSAFEELLNRSRVYRHAAGRHSETSLVDDGRSTLAFSITSSLTLGEVSNISVYAIPVYAVDLSNASCYTFGPAGWQTSEDESVPPAVAQSKERRQDTESPLNRFRRWQRLRKSPQEQTSQQQIPQQFPAAQTTELPIFGVDLKIGIYLANVAISLLNDKGQSYIYGNIPMVVAKCSVFLKEKATEAPLIFEKSGTPTKIKELEITFNQPPRFGRGLDWTEYTVFDAGSILVRFLLKLPDPVIPREFYGSFVDTLRNHQASAVGRIAGQYPTQDPNSFDPDKAVSTFQDLIKQLPPLNRQLLLYLLDLFAVFVSKSDVNLMTTPRLAAAVYRGILIHPDFSNNAQEVRLAQDVLIFLIENQDYFLIGQ